MIQVDLHGVGFEIKEPHDFSWLSALGQVFCAFDNLISGNLCFGLTSGTQKYFVKYAGAKTKMYAGQPENARRFLLNSVKAYEELRHKGFPQLLQVIKTQGGAALVFPWFEGFALAPLDLFLKRLQGMSLVDRLFMYDSLMDALVMANHKDYLISGLSHSQVLINFELREALICSLGHFQKFPAIAPYPKLAGSSWFVPPEGYETGRPLSEGTNVYALGALAFTFFGNPYQKDEMGWSAGRSLYHLASAAILPDIGLRIENPAQYQHTWRDIVRQMPRLSGG